MALQPDNLKAVFQRGCEYDAYVAGAKPNERENWAGFHARVSLTGQQSGLIASFTREMNILCISGAWCGDCVQQLPIFAHIERANPARVRVRFVDRDGEAGLADQLTICSGRRVPVVLFMNEDFDFCALAGDRTLSRYRALAARNLGPSCPMPGAPVPADEIAACVQDWVGECERVQLMLRLSGKLRQRHND